MNFSRTLALTGILLSLNVAAQRPTRISGTILAPKADTVSVFYLVRHADNTQTMEMLGQAPVLSGGRFDLRFKLDSARALQFSDGNETTGLFILPGEKLALEVNTAYFDESMRFTGNGAGRNNALATMALAQELTWSQFGQALLASNGDSTWIAEQITSSTEELNKALADYAERYPEMAAHLNKERALNQRMIAMRQKSARESLAFIALKKELIGKPFVDLLGETTTGDSTRLAQYKGKTTVLDFWATWCGPCKQEMPYWSELQAQYGDRINFVSISVWDNKEKWQAMVADLGHAHGMFISREGLGQLEPYLVRSIPRYMVLDKDHNIVDLDAPRPSQPALLKYF